MKKMTKILFFVAAISMALVIVPRVVLGGWHDMLWAPLVVAILSLVGALATDLKTIFEFMTMRTTKHGLNMGTVILLTLALLVALNFLSVQKNKSLDITEEKLNSLAEQSVELVKGAKNPIDFVIFYRGDQARRAVNMLRENLRLYENAGEKVSVRFYDSYLENMLAQQYLNDLPDRDGSGNELFLFVEVDGKRERIQSPFDEAQITAALVRATRKSNKTIYVLKGHGEKDMMASGQEGLSAFKEELEGQAAKVESLSLLDGAAIPDDASLVVIPGPSEALLDGELEQLRAYAKKGGHLLVFADPGQRHNLAQLMRTFGVETSNRFVVNDPRAAVVSGGSPLTVVAFDFDASSDITKAIPKGNAFSIFHLATDVKRAADAPAEFKYSEFVRTSEGAQSIAEITREARPGEPRSYTLGLSVTGKFKDGEGKESDKEFRAVFFGDSDIATNKLLFANANRDLVMNSVSYLVGEGDLITIRPKAPKQVKLMMTQNQQLGVVVAGVAMPMLLLTLGGVSWLRRRGA